ncbi:down syndrome cell adhesion molecule [Caerostris darwini]|uniref:Down syndrome cell adhesion molecule n=1 Tax=Caerostris darwini TaxID=1538125 RepID=A0AAV4PCW3_9ARAC|nr:down syndrome cell adhesion molecule [Caerostris darwini]
MDKKNQCSHSAFSANTLFIPKIYFHRWSRRTSGQTLDISTSDERRHVINGTLILRRVTPQDGGFYVCVAKCEAGEVRSETQLTVRGETFQFTLESI